MRAALSRRAALARPAPSAAATRSRSAQALEAPYVEDTYVALDRDRRHAAPVAFAESYAAPAFGRISTGDQYVASLRGRDLPVYLFGENIDEFVDHPIVWPSVNAVAETYRLAEREPELATVYSSLIGGRVHRFAHICESAEDVVAQNRMQRKMGQLTGTCFQRCVGQDCMNASWTTTHLIDAAHGTAYQARLKAFVQHVQSYNLTVGGAMTDPKGDRSKPPHAQEDPDMFVRVVDRGPDGVVLRGAKVHQTGTLNSHWMVVMPGQRLGAADADYAISAAIPVDDPRVSYILGRQSCDTRSMEPSGVDVGNAKFGGQEVTVVLDDVFVPYDRVFMDGETEFAADLVERFTAYHRRSYVCKAGVGDVLIGAAAEIADMNGVAKASHIKDKLVEMTHLNETIFGVGIAASMSAKPTPAGNYEPDVLLANICKHHVTRFPYEIARLAQDLAGGVVVTMPSDDDFNSEEIGAILKKYLCAAPGVDPDDRRRVLRLIENMTMGRNAVGYLAESMHGAGSPAAQRVLIQKLGQIAEKRGYARDIAGCGGACSKV
jgi:4-hydroxybutyryl-CoA dehydratase/vinylacetyl-CoA-Delta-isomerase